MFVAEVLSGAGGIGKSTLCLCIAGYWAKQGARVALVDLDESKQVVDACEGRKLDFDVLNDVPGDGYDICIIDNAPGTSTPTNKPDVIIYPMLPHAKSANAFERTRKMVKGNIVFVTNKVDARKAAHRQYRKQFADKYGALAIHDWSFYESVLELGVNFLDLPKNNTYYKAKNEIALLVAEIESYI